MDVLLTLRAIVVVGSKRTGQYESTNEACAGAGEVRRHDGVSRQHLLFMDRFVGGVRPTQHNRVLNTAHVFGGGDGCAMGDAKNEVAGYGEGRLAYIWNVSVAFCIYRANLWARTALFHRLASCSSGGDRS